MIIVEINVTQEDFFHLGLQKELKYGGDTEETVVFLCCKRGQQARTVSET